MTELEGLIRFWEATIKGTWFLLDPSVKLHVENTIKYLKELQAKQNETKEKVRR